MSDRNIYTIQHEASAVQLMCFYVLPSHDHKYPNQNEYKIDTNQNNPAS